MAGWIRIRNEYTELRNLDVDRTDMSPTAPESGHAHGATAYHNDGFEKGEHTPGDVYTQTDITEDRSPDSPVVVRQISRPLEVKDTTWGLGNWHPAAFQCCASVLWFTILAGFGNFFTGLVRTSMSAQLVSFERQFGISSSLSGMLDTANFAGMAVTVLFTGHFSRTLHIPRTIAVCNILAGLALFLPGILHFTDPYHIGDHTRTTVDNDTGATVTVDDYVCVPQLNNTDEQDEEEDRNRSAMLTIIAVMVFNGFMVPFRYGPMPTVYVDDNILDKTKIGLYLAIMQVSYELVGPIGEVYNGFISDVPVDLDDSTIPKSDPRFVSAWWIGFLAFGTATIFFSFPLLFQPRQLLSKREQEEGLERAMVSFAGGARQRAGGKANLAAEEPPKPRRRSSIFTDVIGETSHQLAAQEGVATQRRVSLSGQIIEVPVEKEEPRLSGWAELKKTIMDYPRALMRIFSSPLYVLLLIEWTIIIIPLVGMGPFQIKYVIFEYHVSQGEANMARGLSTAITNILGTVVSSLICTRIHTRRGYLILILLATLGSACLMPLYFIFGCDNDVIHGLQGQFGSPVENASRVCECDQVEPLLSCGDDGLTYLNPCVAGCSSKNDTTYLDCANLANGANGTTLRTDTCDPGCFQNFIIYNCVKATAVFIYQLAAMPKQLLALRVTEPKDRAIANSFMFFGVVLVAIPGVQLFARVMDGACTIWQGQCGYYDRDRLRYIISGTEISTASVAFLVYSLMLIVCIYLDRKVLQKEKEVAQAERQATGAGHVTGQGSPAGPTIVVTDASGHERADL